MFILDIKKREWISAEIVLADQSVMPLKKNGWNFNWRILVKEPGTQTFVLRIAGQPQTIEGILQLRTENAMLIMEIVELAPHNIGRKVKKYEHIAGCLIAYACRVSFQIRGNYKGFLTFTSKTDLIEWYMKKYGAVQASGQRMYIDPTTGLGLIGKYLIEKK